MEGESGGKTVLFVDDEIYLAEVGQEMLEDYGFEVDISTNAPEALKMFEKDPDRFDLLVTDYTMPMMTGDVLMEKIRGIRPDLPVIVCTGISLPPEVMERIKDAVLLMKPFDMDDLITTVRNIFQ